MKEKRFEITDNIDSRYFLYSKSRALYEDIVILLNNSRQTMTTNQTLSRKGKKRKPFFSRTASHVLLFGALVFSSKNAFGAVNAQGELCRAVTTCLGSGETDCDRSSGTCPPCLYAISGGYSCYPKLAGKCPFNDLAADCELPTPGPAPSPSGTADGETDPPVPIAPTFQPEDRMIDVDVDGSGDFSLDDKKNSTATRMDSDDGSLSSSDRAKNEKKETAQGSNFGNVAIIVGICMIAALLCLFVVRRIKTRRHQPVLKTPELNGGIGVFTIATGTIPLGSKKEYKLQSNGYSFGYNQHLSPKNRRTKSDASDVESLMSAPSIVSSSGEFTFGMDMEDPGFRTSEPSRSQPRSHPRLRSRSSKSLHQPSMIEEEEEEADMEYRMSMDSFSDKTSSSSMQSISHSHFIVDETRVSQDLEPNQVDEYGVVDPDAPNQVDEYDIVDPDALSNDGRNTETLVRDGRFRFYSTASVASSYAGSEVDDLSVYGTSPSMKEAEI